MGFGTTPKQCGIHSKSQSLFQKSCLSYASETLATYARMCLCMHALLAYTSRDSCTQAEGHFGHFIF